MVDAKYLPKQYGGECSCDPSGGLCLDTVYDVGPWTDYNMNDVAGPNPVTKKTESNQDGPSNSIEEAKE